MIELDFGIIAWSFVRGYLGYFLMKGNANAIAKISDKIFLFCFHFHSMAIYSIE